MRYDGGTHGQLGLVGLVLIRRRAAALSSLLALRAVRRKLLRPGFSSKSSTCEGVREFLNLVLEGEGGSVRNEKRSLREGDEPWSSSAP